VHKKNKQKSKRNFLSVRYIRIAKRGVLERVEDDDTRDHQKAANLVKRSEICDETQIPIMVPI